MSTTTEERASRSRPTRPKRRSCERNIAFCTRRRSAPTWMLAVMLLAMPACDMPRTELRVVTARPSAPPLVPEGDFVLAGALEGHVADQAGRCETAVAPGSADHGRTVKLHGIVLTSDLADQAIEVAVAIGDYRGVGTYTDEEVLVSVAIGTLTAPQLAAGAVPPAGDVAPSAMRRWVGDSTSEVVIDDEGRAGRVTAQLAPARIVRPSPAGRRIVLPTRDQLRAVGPPTLSLTGSYSCIEPAF